MTVNCSVNSNNEIAHHLASVKHSTNSLEPDLNGQLLQKSELNQQRKNPKKQGKEGAGCSYLLGRVQGHKSDLLANHLKYKYGLIHYNTPSSKID